MFSTVFLAPISIGAKVKNGIEDSNGFLYLFFNVTDVCNCGWRGKTHSRLNLFSYYDFAHKLALNEYFLHEKIH